VQHIFLPRMNSLLAVSGALPRRCGIEPMAAEYFKNQAAGGEGLIRAFRAIDEILG